MSPNRKAVTFEEDTYGTPVRKQRAGTLTLAYQKHQFHNQKNQNKSPPMTPTSIMRGRERVVHNHHRQHLASSRSSSPCVVLHGRVVHSHPLSENNNSSTHQQEAREQPSSSSSSLSQQQCSIRQNMERKSKLSELTIEMKQFQTMVMELDSILNVMNSSSQSLVVEPPQQRVTKNMTTTSADEIMDEQRDDRHPHQWRARIKIKAAQETDQKLFEKLYNYEKTLSCQTTNNNNVVVDDELRKAQTACMRLHRDFKQTHKQLVMILSKYYSQQQQQPDSTQPPALGIIGSGVGWSGSRQRSSSCASLSSNDIPSSASPPTSFPPSHPIQSPLIEPNVKISPPPLSSMLHRKETPDITSNTSATHSSTTTEEDDDYEEEEYENPTVYDTSVEEDLCWICGVFGGGGTHSNLSSTFREEMDMATNEMMLIGKEVVLKSKRILLENSSRQHCAMPMSAFDCGNNENAHTDHTPTHPVVVNQS